MSELITYIKERIGDGSEDFEEIFKYLKKTKNIMKRQRAKNRKLSLEGRLKLENENVIFSLS
jgi:glucosamine 6-phosphate synthetase-like amidotransferase/phosphosugar isomerase protein